MNDFQTFLDTNLTNVTLQPSDEKALLPEYDIFKEVQELVSQVREELGYTQKELAQKCGLTQANISNIEKGTSHPTIETLKKIADATGKRLVIAYMDSEVIL